ncbi:hypothetical protein HDU86_005415 [Geranomyces michiganensis]|nr:hypothetical protein HDU86_005415 [Geranomyces michiganensis]
MASDATEPLQLRLTHDDYTKYCIHPPPLSSSSVSGSSPSSSSSSSSSPGGLPSFDAIVQAFETTFPDFNLKSSIIEYHDGDGYVELQNSPEQMHIFYAHIEQDRSTAPRRGKAVLRSRRIAPEFLRKDAICVDAIVDAAVCLQEKLGKVLSMRLCVDCRSVLIVTKPQDPSIVPLTRKAAQWFLDNHTSDIYVNDQMRDKAEFDYARLVSRGDAQNAKHRLHFWTPEWVANNYKSVSLIVTMGGDGTVLFAAGLFQRSVPPVVSFHLGSLGFLTNFQFDEYPEALQQILSGPGKYTTFRQRLCCTLYRACRRDSFDDDAAPSRLLKCKRGEVRRAAENGCSTCERPPSGKPNFETQVMNEIVLDRGASAGLLMLELYADELHLTTIQADGLVVATATGSTAYSLSAGGSLVHPEKSAILITPVCAHTLTCRPMILPSRTRLRVCVSSNSRVPAWVSFDGRNRMELQKTDSVIITASRYPLLQIAHDDKRDDWFRSLVSNLSWNQRSQQKAFI